MKQKAPLRASRPMGGVHMKEELLKLIDTMNEEKLRLLYVVALEFSK